MFFWKNAKGLDHLKQLAKVILNRSASSVDDECMFSTMGLILDGKRSRLSAQSADALSFIHDNFLPARRRPQGLVIIGVCLCALFLSARYLKNGCMDHHQIWWVGAGGKPLEQVQFRC